MLAEASVPEVHQYLVRQELLFAANKSLGPASTTVSGAPIGRTPRTICDSRALHLQRWPIASGAGIAEQPQRRILGCLDLQHSAHSDQNSL